MAQERRNASGSALKTAMTAALVAGCALGTALAVYYFFVPLARENLRMLGKEARLKSENAAKEKENARLLDELRQLGSNPVYVEKVARDELGLGKPGELVYRFKSPEKEK